MSILPIPKVQSKLNLAASSISQEKTTNTKKKKLRKNVRFTFPLASDTKIIHYPILSVQEKRQLYYNENDISKFRYEYFKFKHDTANCDSTISDRYQCTTQQHQYTASPNINTTTNTNNVTTTFKSKILNAVIISMACIRVATYLLCKNVYIEALLSNIKNARNILFGDKKQSPLYEQPHYYDNQRGSNLIVVFNDDEKYFYDSV